MSREDERRAAIEAEIEALEAEARVKRAKADLLKESVGLKSPSYREAPVMDAPPAQPVAPPAQPVAPPAQPVAPPAQPVAKKPTVPTKTCDRCFRGVPADEVEAVPCGMGQRMRTEYWCRACTGLDGGHPVHTDGLAQSESARKVTNHGKKGNGW